MICPRCYEAKLDKHNCCPACNAYYGSVDRSAFTASIKEPATQDRQIEEEPVNGTQELIEEEPVDETEELIEEHTRPTVGGVVSVIFTIISISGAITALLQGVLGEDTTNWTSSGKKEQAVEYTPKNPVTMPTTRNIHRTSPYSPFRPRNSSTKRLPGTNITIPDPRPVDPRPQIPRPGITSPRQGYPGSRNPYNRSPYRNPNNPRKVK